MVELQKKLRQIKEIFGKEVIFRIGVTKKGKVEIISAENLQIEMLKGEENTCEGTTKKPTKEDASYIG